MLVLAFFRELAVIERTSDNEDWTSVARIMDWYSRWKPDHSQSHKIFFPW